MPESRGFVFRLWFFTLRPTNAREENAALWSRSPALGFRLSSECTSKITLAVGTGLCACPDEARSWKEADIPRRRGMSGIQNHHRRPPTPRESSYRPILKSGFFANPYLPSPAVLSKNSRTAFWSTSPKPMADVAMKTCLASAANGVGVVAASAISEMRRRSLRIRSTLKYGV